MMNKWRNPLIICVLALFIGLSMWMSGRAREQDLSRTIRFYGGNAPEHVQLVLERMNSHLEQAKQIISAQSDRIVFVNRDGECREYAFVHRALWANHYPVITNVNHFYFEYRNPSGYLITRFQERNNEIQKVGYSIRLTRDNREMVACSTVDVSPVTAMQSCGYQVAWAD